VASETGIRQLGAGGSTDSNCPRSDRRLDGPHDVGRCFQVSKRASKLRLSPRYPIGNAGCIFSDSAHSAMRTRLGRQIATILPNYDQDDLTCDPKMMKLSEYPKRHVVTYRPLYSVGTAACWLCVGCPCS
jgi:hypothetical protein